MSRPVVSLICLCLTAAFSGCSRSPSTAPAASETKTIKPVQVRTVSVTQQDVKKTSTQPATVHAFHKAEIRPRVSGYLTAVNVDIGDVVSEGDTLAVVDLPEMAAQREVLQARIESRKAEEEQAKAGVALAAAAVKSAEAELDEAGSQLKSADAFLAAAEAEFNRTKDLVDRQSVEPRLLDEARKKRDAEAARKAALGSAVASAAASVAVAEAKHDSAAADVKTAAADTKTAEKQLDELDVQMKFAQVTAPFTGIVTARRAEPGNLVGQSADESPLFEVSKVDVVRVRISVPERDAAYINRGDAVTLTFPSFESQDPLEVQVTRTSGSLDPGTRMMLIEADVKNEDGRLIPGMFGQAQIALHTADGVAVLPARAVRFTETGEAYVYTVSDDKVSVVSVDVGNDNGKEIEVVSGLEAGQTVIDAHLQRFTDGQQVEVLR